VGVILGIPLATVARLRARPKRSVGSLVRPMAILLVCNGGVCQRSRACGLHRRGKRLGAVTCMSATHLADCTDGTAYTMIVAEQSGWLLDQIRRHRRRITAIQAGRSVGQGLVEVGCQVPVELLQSRKWKCQAVHQQTGVQIAGTSPRFRYPPNLQNASWDHTVAGLQREPRHQQPAPIPHPRGLQVAMVNGAVRFVSETIDLEVLLRLAIRNDGVKTSSSGAARGDDQLTGYRRQLRQKQSAPSPFVQIFSGLLARDTGPVEHLHDRGLHEQA